MITKKLKILCYGHMLLVVLMVKKFLERCMKKNCKRKIKQSRIEKVIKRKGDKQCVKWKEYDNSFTS